jgi:putative ABC transport system substrate-binding protein
MLAMAVAAYALLDVFGLAVCAQQPAKIPKIAVLIGSSFAANAVRIEAFRQGLRELGYLEGKNVVLEFRSADGHFDRLPRLAAEIVSSNTDLIVTTGPIVNPPARDATSKIPIVMAFDNDPVGNRLVASLARPGGNITGLSNIAPEISGKQLELLKEIVPQVLRVTLVGNSKEPANQHSLNEAELAASALKIKLHYVDIGSPEQIDGAFDAAIKARANALIVLGSFILNPHRATVANRAIGSRLPVAYNAGEWVEAGGLMSYGTSFPDLFRRAAHYVDKILKGARPAELPIEQPTKFELIINLKSAKQIGLTIPPNVLARADRVIK